MKIARFPVLILLVSCFACTSNNKKEQLNGKWNLVRIEGVGGIQKSDSVMNNFIAARLYREVIEIDRSNFAYTVYRNNQPTDTFKALYDVSNDGKFIQTRLEDYDSKSYQILDLKNDTLVIFRNYEKMYVFEREKKD
jgi:hypothetical protein